MRNDLKVHEIDEAKIRIKALLKANAKIQDLTDQELHILHLIIQKELQVRDSSFARRGFDPGVRLV